MGYSLDLFINKEQIHEEFICSICQDVMKEPIMSQSCEHIFCNSCINDWGRHGSAAANVSCPIDREQIVGLRVPFRAFMNIYNGFELKCWFDDCGGIFNLGQIADHVAVCEYNPEAILPCNYNCGAAIKMKDLPAHDCYEYLKQQVEKKDLEMVQLRDEFEHKLTVLTKKNQEQGRMIEAKDVEIEKLKEDIQKCHKERVEALVAKDKEIDGLKRQQLVGAENRRVYEIEQCKKKGSVKPAGLKDNESFYYVPI